MNAETWTCLKCGEEEIGIQFDTRWNCGTSRYEHEPARQREVAAPEKMLSEILHLQRRQTQTLKNIQSKVGCLYIYMVVGLVLGVLAVYLSLHR